MSAPNRHGCRLSRAPWPIVAVLFAMLAGCASTGEQERRRRPGATELLVEDVVIAGTDPFPPRQIKRGLATQPDPGRFWSRFGADRRYFNKLDWRKDLERIRTFYESRGYFDVEIVRENILRDSDEGTVRLELMVDPGEPSTVSTLKLEGLDGVSTLDRTSVAKKLPLEEGKVFTEEDYLAAKNGLDRRLEQRGYAYAEVTGRAVAYPDRKEVHVRLIADPGPKAVFDEVEIRGLETIPKSFVKSAITFEPGEPYSSQALQRTQQAIYAMDVFSIVKVQPAHQVEAEESRKADDESATVRQANHPPDQSPALQRATGISSLLRSAQTSAEKRSMLDREIPIVVQVKESRHWNVRVGAGVAAEIQRQDAHGQFEVTSENFLGGLRKFSWSTKAGYAWAPGLLFVGDNQAAREGIILSSELEFVQPWLFDQKTKLRFAPAIERDLRIGYRLWNPSARFGIDREFFGHLTLGAGYRISYYSFSDVDEDLLDLRNQRTEIRLNFRREFMLEALEQTATLDFLDNPISPRRGVRAQLAFEEASNYLFGGEFDFLKISTSIEGYIPFHLFTPATLALRARLGTIYNLEPGEDEEGDSQPVPTTSRFYSGGKGSFRSMGRQTVSLYQGSIPVGGLTQFEASVEPRFRLVSNLFGVGDLWGTIFLDAATVERGQFLRQTPAGTALGHQPVAISGLTSSMLYGLGTGAWWNTPVGPVRFDFGYTLSDIQRDARFRQVTCQTDSETGEQTCSRVPLSEDEIQSSIRPFNFIVGIGHSF